MGDYHNHNPYYEEYEVFSRKTLAAPFQHQFSLLAPNHELALVMAQENFMRREIVADIWVVNRKHIHGLDQEGRKSLQRLDNKNYRKTKGYGYLNKKWQEKGQQALDNKEIMSWGEGWQRDKNIGGRSE